MIRQIRLILFVIMIIPCFIFSVTADNPDNYKYYTSTDVMMYDQEYWYHYFYYVDLFGFPEDDAKENAELQALGYLGFEEIPVEGAIRSDFDSTLPYPDAYLDPEPDPESDKEVSNMESLGSTLEAIGLVFSESVGWMEDVIGVVVGTPILLISVSFGFAFKTIAMYQKIRR